MSKRLLTAFCICLFVIAYIPQSLSQMTIGGHMKMTVFDYKNGDSNGLSSSENSGMALNEFILYFSTEVSDRITVDIQPLFDALTGATPRFGSEIGDSFAGVQPKFNEFRKAVISVYLPYEVELAAGIVKPRFTWDYGSELFWEEELNGGKFTCNDYLGAMHETGIELYKPFMLGNISLPTYLYFLNGGPGGQKNLYNDNNSSPSVMVHIEPEMGALRLHASLARGAWDDDGDLSMTRYAAGAAYEWSSLSVRAEVAGGNWEKSIPAATLQDATPFGYYAKALYRFSEWGRAMVHFDYAKHNFNGFFSSAPGEEEYLTITPGLIISVAPSSMFQIQYDIADWSKYNSSGEEDTLKFNRLSIGWRATF